MRGNLCGRLHQLRMPCFSICPQIIFHLGCLARRLVLLLSQNKHTLSMALVMENIACTQQLSALNLLQPSAQ